MKVQKIYTSSNKFSVQVHSDNNKVLINEEAAISTLSFDDNGQIIDIDFDFSRLGTSLSLNPNTL